VETRAQKTTRTTSVAALRRELVDLAKRYDRRGDHFDQQSRQGRSAAPTS
jgi:hypothetical protein